MLNHPIGKNLILQSTILLNGNERLTYRNAQYFEYVQEIQHTKFHPATGINIYSYALHPFEPVQPSGTFNTSQIDNIQMKINMSQNVNINNTVLFRCYGLCINNFRIINGLGALMFTK